MMAESLTNKTIKGVCWSFMDSISNQGITFLVGLVLARLLTPEDYGMIGIIMIFISVFNSIVDSGFSNALIRKNDVSDKDYNTVFVFNLVLSVLLCLMLYACSPLIADFFEHSQLNVLLKVMSCIVVINAFAIIQRTIFVKNIDFKIQTKVSLISSISSGIIGITIALKGLGVWSLVGQQVSRQLLNTTFLWIYARWRPRLEFSIQSFKELFGFGWKLLVSGLLATIWNEIYQIVIGKCYSPATLGQYTRASQFSSICSSNLTTIVQRVSYPVLSSIQDDKERLKTGYKRIIKLSMLVTFVLMLGIAGVAKSMILVLVGDQWLESVPYLQIICFSMMLYPLHALNLNILQVQGRSDLFLKLEIVKKVIAVIPLCLGIFVGIYYMLIGGVITGFFSYYLNAYYSGPALNYSIKEQVKDILPSFGIAITMALIVYTMSYIPLIPFVLFPLQVIAGVIITILLCKRTKLSEYQEIEDIAIAFLSQYRK